MQKFESYFKVKALEDKRFLEVQKIEIPNWPDFILTTNSKILAVECKDRIYWNLKIWRRRQLKQFLLYTSLPTNLTYLIHRNRNVIKGKIQVLYSLYRGLIFIKSSNSLKEIISKIV